MKILVFGLACVLCPLAVFAQPTITSTSGPLVHDGAVTLTGTSFGSKTTAAPRKFDDFASGGSPGATIANGWSVTRNGIGGPGAYPTYSTARVRHARDTRSARANFVFSSDSNYTYLSSFGLNSQSWITNGIYIDAWMYVDYGGTDGVNYSRNHKPIRIHAGDEAFPNLYIAYWNPLYASNSIVDQDSLDATSFANKSSPMSGWDANDFENHWTHVQMYLVQSTVNTTNGIVWVRLNGTTVVNRANVISRDTSTNGNNPWAQVLFGNYMGHDECCGGSPPEQGIAFPFNGYSDWSDVYIDSTPARVELCNSATYTSSTHCETQIPTAWSNTSITVTAKQGSFAASDSVFLFVCNSSNVCSAGRSITFGNLPAKPTNLRIVPPDDAARD